MKLTLVDWKSEYFGSNTLVYYFAGEDGNHYYWRTASDKMDAVRAGETIEAKFKETSDCYTDKNGIKQIRIKNVRW